MTGGGSFAGSASIISVKETYRISEILPFGVGDGLGMGLTVGDGVGDGLGVTVGLGVGVGIAVGVGVGVGLTVGVGVELDDGVGVGEKVGLGEALSDVTVTPLVRVKLGLEPWPHVSF